MKIKQFNKTDLTEVKDVLYKAFLNHPHGDPQRGPTEHLIVESLVNNNNDICSTLAIDNDNIIGFITYSKVSFDNDNGAWVGMGPVAVLPEYQNKGIGKKLIEYTLQIINENYDGCVVMGDPEYYTRFGFNVVNGLFFEGVPQEYFMAKAFKDIIPQGKVIYNQAFFV
ncbi:MAG: GNAT family N-acetyltransferase [Alphaproteobacteria bacterium]